MDVTTVPRDEHKPSPPVAPLGNDSTARRRGNAEHRSRWSLADAVVPALFMMSGAAGLIYQVVWTRDLVLLFGNTTQAIVTTVTAFLAGLGLGALLGGWLGNRLRRPLRFYGALEIAVACLAALTPLAFDYIETVFRSAYLSMSPGTVALVRFLLTFFALAPVTVLMGMTLPLLTAHLVRGDRDISSRIARLYGLNTMGAVLGTFVTGFVLIGVLGLRETTYCAVAMNACAGIGALLISLKVPAHAVRSAPVDSSYLPASSPDEKSTARRLSRRQGLLIVTTFVSGFVSLALEVLWTRALIQATGSAIYIFSSVLGTFLAGIAVGSLVFERDKARNRNPRLSTLGMCLATTAVLALVPLAVSDLNGPSRLGAAVVLIFPVTAILGYAFPLTVRLFVAHAADASRGVGMVYAGNTAGCVAGTVAAGFLLVPTLGTNASITTLCILQACLGAALVVGFGRRHILRPLIATGLVAGIAISFAVPAMRLTYVQLELARWPRHTAHFEDNIADVDVVGGPPAYRRLFVNGIGVTRLTIDTKLLAYLPKTLRPGAETALVICFGMGSTYRSSLILGMRTDAVELDPTVPRLMSWFYPDAERYLHSPLGHVIIGDGRNYVRLTNKRYDIIVIDSPPPLTSAGTVVLLTHEFYQEAAKRLNPGGVLVSYLPGGVPNKLLLRTFRSSFRYVMVVDGLAKYLTRHVNGYYQIGSQAPLTFETSAIEQTFGSAAAQADLAGAPDWPRTPADKWPSIIRQHVLLVNSQVDRYVGRGPLLTDDRPITEYYLLH